MSYKSKDGYFWRKNSTSEGCLEIFAKIENCRFWDFLAIFRPKMTRKSPEMRFWGNFGPLRGHVGPFLAILGPFLGHLKPFWIEVKKSKFLIFVHFFGNSGPIFGPKWPKNYAKCNFRAIFDHLGVTWDHFWPFLGHFGAISGPLWTEVKNQNFRIFCSFSEILEQFLDQSELVRQLTSQSAS